MAWKSSSEFKYEAFPIVKLMRGLMMIYYSKGTLPNLLWQQVQTMQNGGNYLGFISNWGCGNMWYISLHCLDIVLSEMRNFETICKVFSMLLERTMEGGACWKSWSMSHKPQQLGQSISGLRRGKRLMLRVLTAGTLPVS